MCGIAGYVADEGFDGSAMIRSLRHRGPDSAGRYETTIGGRTVFLGHQRLSIIDLTPAGSQPMRAHDVPVTISYNGEVYNFESLRRRFLPEHTFRSRTDTEVLLRLYLVLGPGFVRHLNGDFAIAVLDERSGRLFLYRDHMGVKPLYVYESGGSFAFASEIKAFLAAGLSLSLSEESIQRFMVFKYVPGNETMHRQVRRVPPGTYFEYEVATGRLGSHRFWTPSPDPTLATRSEAEARENLRELMGDAVRIRLMGDVPVGTFFSGGVDSSIIASYLKNEPDIIHYCARKSRDDLKTEGTTSDFAHAEQLATAWGIDLRAIDIGTDQATPELIRRTLYHSDDLIADGSQIPSWLIARQAAKSSRVVLSGMGADEIFYGYAAHLLVLLARYIDWLPRGVARGLTGWFGKLDQGRGSFLAHRRWLHRLGKYHHAPGLRYGTFALVGDYENSLGLCRMDPDAVGQYLAGYFPEGEDPFDGLTRFQLDNFLVKNLHYLDRMCMANSVEGRVPYMDPRIVEFALGLRHHQKLSPLGTSKRILKRAFSGVLPRSLLRRRKAGFGMPLRSMFRDESAAWRLIDLDFFGGMPIFDVDRIPSLVRQHAEGREDNSSIIYALVSFQEWYRLFHEGGALDQATTASPCWMPSDLTEGIQAR